MHFDQINPLLSFFHFYWTSSFYKFFYYFHDIVVSVTCWVLLVSLTYISICGGLITEAWENSQWLLSLSNSHDLPIALQIKGYDRYIHRINLWIWMSLQESQYLFSGGRVYPCWNPGTHSWTQSLDYYLIIYIRCIYVVSKSLQMWLYLNS